MVRSFSFVIISIINEELRILAFADKLRVPLFRRSSYSNYKPRGKKGKELDI